MKTGDNKKMKTGDKRFNDDKFIQEIYVVDRWLDLESLEDMMAVNKNEAIKILEIEFGDKLDEARQFLGI